MLRRTLTSSAIALGAGLVLAAPAQALTMKECSAKYQAAKTANTLKGQKWNDFRKAECGDDDASEADAAAAVPDEPKTSPTATRTATTTGAQPAPKPVAGGKLVFPSEVSAKYASETAGKARMHTCVDQYKANKDTGGNGDLRWIMKGGGYYSQCNAKLKS